MGRKIFPLLFVIILIVSQTGCLYGNIVDNKYTTTGVGNLTPVKSLTYYVGSPTYTWAGGYFANLTSNYYNVYNTNTNISRDGAGNMIFTDAVSGTHTLADLTVGSGGNVTGAGTLGRITQWTSASTIGDATNTDAQVSAAVTASHAQNTDTALGVLGADLNMGGNSITNVNLVDGIDVSTLGTGNVTGGGAPTRLAYWDGATSLGDTNIYFDVPLGYYGIGTVTPATMLQIHDGSGANQLQLSYTAGSIYTNITSNHLGYLLLNPTGDRAVLSGNLSMDTHYINNVIDPSVAQDAATKNYVDNAVSGMGTGNVTGAGTTGYIPAWVSASVIGNSVATSNTTGVYVTGKTTTDTLQVGTATPIFSLYSGSGFMSQLQVDGAAILRSSNWSVSQLNYGAGSTIPEHTGTGNYDYTGNATAERLFYATAPVFDSTDDDGKMILLLSGTYTGAVVEIEHYISSTEVQVTSDNGWTSDLTGVAFGILPTPTFGIANSGSARFSMGGESTLAMRSLGATSFAPVNVQVINGGNDVSAFEVDVINGGYTRNEAIDLNFITGNMAADTRASILKISVDKSGASSSTNTTEIDFINIEQVGKNDTQSHAIHIGQGFDTAFSVSGGTRADPSYGYTVVSATDTPTDRVTGVAPGGTAFLDTSAGNVQMFVSNNDYILIGSTAPFEAIPVYLTIGASHNINQTYYYSTGVGTWATLVATDTTAGFQNNGIISFNAPVAWTQTNKTLPAGASITNGYYVKIVRTRATVTTVPTESYFKLYTSSSTTDFLIRGNGTIRPVAMADASAPNDSIYYSTTASKLVYKDQSGVVRNLY